MGTRIYANKVDYITYLFANPEIEKSIGNKLLLPAVAVMNFMLFTRGYCSTEESSKKNRVYRGSIDSFLEALPSESINQVVKKLIGINQIVRTERDDLQLSDAVLQYFYRVTDNETFKTLETKEKVKTNDTDDRWSSLTGLLVLRKETIRDKLRNQKLHDIEFQSERGQNKIMLLLVYTYMNSVLENSAESQFVQDIVKIFSHFGVDTGQAKILYREAKVDFKENRGLK